MWGKECEEEGGEGVEQLGAVEEGQREEVEEEERERERREVATSRGSPWSVSAACSALQRERRRKTRRRIGEGEGVGVGVAHLSVVPASTGSQSGSTDKRGAYTPVSTVHNRRGVGVRQCAV